MLDPFHFFFLLDLKLLFRRLLLFIILVLGIEPRTLCRLGKRSLSHTPNLRLMHLFILGKSWRSSHLNSLPTPKLIQGYSGTVLNFKKLLLTLGKTCFNSFYFFSRLNSFPSFEVLFVVYLIGLQSS